MRTELQRSLLAAAFAVVSLSTSQADAFCRTTTQREAPDYLPPDGSGCLPGTPLYLPSQCFPYRLTREVPVISNAVLSDKLARAFAAWTTPNSNCTPGITPIELAPLSTPLTVGYNVSQPAQNLVGVRADWENEPGEADNLGRTTVTYNHTTGAILDVDLELNGSVDWSFDDTPPADKIDLLSVLSHEVGHMIGIGHSSVADAAMSPLYVAGSIEARTLKADDQAAICTVYPNRLQRLAESGPIASTPCALAPGNADGSCAAPEISHGCSMSAPSSGTSRAAGVGFLVVALATASRRRRVR